MSEPQNVTGLVDLVHELKTQLAAARKGGAITALRMVAADWRGDHVASAAAVADDLTAFASALETGKLTLP